MFLCNVKIECPVKLIVLCFVLAFACMPGHALGKGINFFPFFFHKYISFLSRAGKEEHKRGFVKYSKI